MYELGTDDEEVQGSPKLEPRKPRLTPSPSPQPFINSRDSSKTPESDEEPGQSARPKKKQKKGPKPSQGDVVLLRHMEPNRPDIAYTAGRHRFLSTSPSISHSSERDMDLDLQGPVAVATATLAPVESRERSTSDAVATLYNRPTLFAATTQQTQNERLHPRSAFVGSSTWSVSDRRKSDGYEMRKAHSWDPLRGRDYPFGMSNGVKRSLSPDGDDSSIATSPRLAQHMISAQDVGGKAELPAIDPEGLMSHTKLSKALPPVGPLLDVADKTNDEARRRSRASSHSVLSTSSSLSPRRTSHTFPTALRSPNRMTPATPMTSVGEHSRQNSISTTSPSTSRNSPATTTMGYNSVSGTSPRRSADFIAAPPGRQGTGSSTTSHPGGGASTSTEGLDSTRRTTPTMRRSSLETIASDHATVGSLPIYSAAQNHTAGFKCEFEGCNAPAFATQYLLNSHANVHSTDRPHFCSVESCPRGPGGKGFKRKNEMIRHGLVHESPGYTCPFCPGRQHDYPRPDNLQRHVKTNHRDIKPDDERLREVLDQRLKGGTTKGRRRRT